MNDEEFEAALRRDLSAVRVGPDESLARHMTDIAMHDAVNRRRWPAPVAAAAAVLALSGGAAAIALAPGSAHAPAGGGPVGPLPTTDSAPPTYAGPTGPPHVIVPSPTGQPALIIPVCHRSGTIHYRLKVELPAGSVIAVPTTCTPRATLPRRSTVTSRPAEPTPTGTAPPSSSPTYVPPRAPTSSSLPSVPRTASPTGNR